jgi:hypothetical protein
MKKSVAKRLVNKGWSIKLLRIFLNITIPVKHANVCAMFKKWWSDLLSGMCNVM